MSDIRPGSVVSQSRWQHKKEKLGSFMKGFLAGAIVTSIAFVIGIIINAQ